MGRENRRRGVIERGRKNVVKDEMETHGTLLRGQWSTRFNSPLFIFQFQPLFLQSFLHFSMSSIQLFFRLFKFRFFFLNFLLENHLHLCFHLCQFCLLVSFDPTRALESLPHALTSPLLASRRGYLSAYLMEKKENSLGLPENTLILLNTHRPEFFRSIVLIQDIIGMFPQFLHMSPHEHLTELDEITM
jgi:hypothetical protein